MSAIDIDNPISNKNREVFDGDYGIAKYVRIDNGLLTELRFCYLHEDHKSLVKEGEKPVSAGMVSFNTDDDGKFLKVHDVHSMTLRMGPKPEDGHFIAKLFNFRLINET